MHHGEGTQKIFYDRSDVLFISIHRYDKGKFFPHIPESSSSHTGGPHAAGMNVNVCWDLPEKAKGEAFEREETCGDEEYAHAFDCLVMPILKEYSPDMVFVSCGFDSACGDPIGGLLLSQVGYTYMTRRLTELKRKVLLVLEGGYNPDVLLWASEAVLRALTSTTPKDVD